MGERSERCAVCEHQEPRAGGMARVVVEGRALMLCRAHAASVAVARPETFEDLRALFVGISGGAQALPGGVAPERRSPLPRREADDRRVFPPRPEGRRRGAGRRAGDPLD